MNLRYEQPNRLSKPDLDQTMYEYASHTTLISHTERPITPYLSFSGETPTLISVLMGVAAIALTRRRRDEE